MKIEVDINKKYFFGILLIGLILVGLVGVVAYNLEVTSSSGNPPVFGHSVDEMDWSKTIQKNVSAVGFCIGGDCKTSWAQVGGGGGGGSGLNSQWNNSGNNIYYNLGRVGIGTSSPTTALSVAGTIGAEEYANLGEDNYGGLSPVNTGNEDNCNGNRDQQYSCNATEGRTCTDIVGGQKRTITCVGRVYGSRMNSTGIYTSGKVEVSGALNANSLNIGPMKIITLTGTNPSCPENSFDIARKWLSKTCTYGNSETWQCTVNGHIRPDTCTTPNSWNSTASSCRYVDWTSPSSAASVGAQSAGYSYCYWMPCRADSWDAVTCVTSSS